MKATVREVSRSAQAIKFAIQIRGVLSDGRVIRERYTREYENKATAQMFAKARIEALIKGTSEPNTQAAKVPTLAEFFDEFRRVHFESAKSGPLKPSTRREYDVNWRVHIAPRLGNKRLDEIGAHDVKHLAASLAATRKPKTVNNVLVCLKSIFARAREWHGIDTPKVELLRYHQEEVAYWGFDELRLLADEAKRRGPYHYAAVLLGARAGLRAGEIIGLRWGDVDLERRVLSVRTSSWRGIDGTTKSGKIRYVPIEGELAAALEALPKNSARVIRAPKAKQASNDTLRSYLFVCEVGAGLKGSKSTEGGQIHKLRHTFGAHLAMRGVSLYQIQALMGHASPAMTMRYAHLAPSALHDAVKTLGQSAGSAVLPAAKRLRSHDNRATTSG